MIDIDENDWLIDKNYNKSFNINYELNDNKNSQFQSIAFPPKNEIQWWRSP